MALTEKTYRLVAHMCGGTGYATDFQTSWDADGLVLSTPTIRALRKGMRNRKAADLLATAVENDTALGDFAQTRLAIALGSQVAAIEIGDELGS